MESESGWSRNPPNVPGLWAVCLDEDRHITAQSIGAVLRLGLELKPGFYKLLAAMPPEPPKVRTAMETLADAFEEERIAFCRNMSQAAMREHTARIVSAARAVLREAGKAEA